MTTPLVTIPPLASIAQLDAFTSSTSPAGAELVLAAATAMVRRYCGWHITPVVEGLDVIVDARGGSFLALPTLRLVEVTALAVRQRNLDGTFDWVPVDVSELSWSEDGHVEAPGWWALGCPGGRWRRQFRGVSATITTGFDDAEDVTQTVLTMAARALSSPTGAVASTIGAVSETFSAPDGPAGGVRMWADMLRLLDQYRIYGRA